MMTVILVVLLFLVLFSYCVIVLPKPLIPARKAFSNPDLSDKDEFLTYLYLLLICAVIPSIISVVGLFIIL